MRAHRHRAAELHAMRLPRRQRNVDRYARAVLAGAMLHHPHLPFQADQLGAASRMTAQRRAGGQLQALGAAGRPRGIRQTIHDSLIRHR
ncbi:hypothetical protein [Bordetella bronchiseptica]|uniref:hypothetical protein n=1 Tax=Bordetella bronchiseptica TaxID=518 RepID=UPI0012D2E63E|nr:hypothetical protein [Bordetella bronchiseptica]